MAASKAEATWTLFPKHKWDIVAGVALVEAAGGFATTVEGSVLTFNNADSRVSGMIAGGKGLRRPVQDMLSPERRLRRDPMN